MTAAAVLRESIDAVGPKVVSAGHKLAATAGAAALAHGGNAFDAALAACFMEHAALPMKCGLAGDLVALFRREGGPFEAIVSIGAGAAGLMPGAMQRTGPTSVGVPGAPHGYCLLHAMAKLPLPLLAEPAIRAARTGVPWTRIARGYLVEASDLLRQFSPRNPYMPNGRMPEVGDMRTLPGLGELLTDFCREREALFEGRHGVELVERLGGAGFITQRDFRQRPGQILVPASGDIAADMRLSVTPVPTHGSELVGICRAALGSAVPLPTIVADARRAAAGRGRLPADEGTSAVIAADDAGNAVVVLHSNSFPQFASGIVMDTGLILNNRPGRGFDLTAPANSANAPAAGRVPWTTLHAWCLERGDEVVIGATPGGVNQLPWNAQTVTEIARGASLTEAMLAPRWSLSADHVLAVEAGGDAFEGATPIEELSLRSAQQVVALAKRGLHRIAADPRSGATALAVY